MSTRPDGSEGAFWGDVDDEVALERYRVLVDAIDDGLYQLDPEGRFVAVNDAIVETTGYDRDELLGSHVSLLLREEDVDSVEREIERQLAPDSVGIDTIELGVRTADGVWIPCELRIDPLFEDGEFRGTFGVARGVSERGERRLSLGAQADRQRELESELQTILGRISDAFYAVDEEFRFTHVNERAEELLQHSEDELLGERLWDVFPSAAEIDEVWEAFHAARDTQEATSYELYYDTLDFWVEANLYPSESGISVYFRDVTDRKEREARRTEMMRELRESEERLRLALQAGEMGTWELDLRTGESTDRSAQHDRIFGYEEPVEEWDFETFLEHVRPADREHVERTFDEAFETGRWEFECRIGRADGEQRVISVQGEFDFDDGEAVRAVGVVQDVTERRERERQLEEYRRWNRTLMEHFPSGAVALVDRDLRYVTFGGTPGGDTAVTRADLEGEPIREALPEQLAEVVVPRYEATLDGEPSEFEDTIDGRTYQFYFVPVRDDDGEVVAAAAISQDVTEQKEREEQLRDAKLQLEAATEAGAVGTWEWHVPEDEFVTGASFAKTFGVDPEAAREGVPIERLLSSVHAADRDRVAEQIDEAVENCGEYESEYRVRDADGELRWVVARGHVECDEDGNAETFPGALTDITERKRAEFELERQRRELETLFDVLPVGVVVADADGSLLRANDTAQEIWGGDVFDAGSVDEYGKYEAVWADSGEPVGPEDWTMYEVLQGEEVTEPNVYEIDAFDGQRRIIMEHGMPVRDADGEVSRAVVTLTDISERKEYQRKLEESNERLEQFAYAASHDLQEPLRMVTSYLQLVERRYADELDEEAREFIEFAVDGADRMRQMIDGLLEYSRVETRGDPFEQLELDAVLDAVREDLRMRIEETDAEITVEALPRVEGDASQLRQVFQNLLDNAIEYSGDDPPVIHVDAERAGDRWLVSVADEGIGIDPDDADRVFDVFQRLHTNEEHPGTGIGLALCKRIVERHGGSIRVDSEPGEGATFSFTLPAVDEESAL